MRRAAKQIGIVLTLLVTVAGALAVCASATDKPHVSRALMFTMERNLDNRFTKLWDDNPFVLLGGTARGIYLEGYGAVFTSEVNLVTPPTLTFRPAFTKEEVEHHRKKKIERLPQLRAALRHALTDTAASLDTVPGDEQVVIAVLLTKYPWEDVTGLPTQIIMQGQKKKLIEAKTGAVSLDAAIHVTEN